LPSSICTIQGLNVNLKDKDGRTALHYAAESLCASGKVQRKGGTPDRHRHSVSSSQGFYLSVVSDPMSVRVAA